MSDKRADLIKKVLKRGLENANEAHRSDREIVLKAIGQKGSSLQYAHSSLRSDPEIVLKAVAQDCNALQYASVELLTDKDFALRVVSQSGLSLQRLGPTFRADPDIVLAAVEKKAAALQYSLVSQDDELYSESFALRAIEVNACCFTFLPEELQGRCDFVLTACCVNPAVLTSLDTSFLMDRVFVKKLAARNGLILQYAPEGLKADREIVLAAVGNNGLSLQFAAKPLRSDTRIVARAVHQNGLSLAHALKVTDREVVMRAILQNGHAFQFADEILKSDRSFVLRVVGHDGALFQYVNKQFNFDREVVATAVQRRFQTDREYVLKCVSEDGLVLQHASSAFRADRDVVEAAVTQNGFSLQFACEKFRSDPQIVGMATQQNSNAIQYALRSTEDTSYPASFFAPSPEEDMKRPTSIHRLVQTALQADGGEDLWKQVARAREELQQYFSQEEKNPSNVFVFGGCVAFGVWDGRSDIDFCALNIAQWCDGQHDEASDSARVEVVAQRLLEDGFESASLDAVTQTRVPVVRHHRSPGVAPCNDGISFLRSIDFDVSFRGYGVRNSWLQRRYLQQHPSVRLGAILVKRWAKDSNVCDTRNGYLSSYAIVLMWIYYLVRRGRLSFIPPESVLPLPCDPRDIATLYSPLSFEGQVEDVATALEKEVAGLLLGFYQYYATQFPYESRVISLNASGIVSRESLGWGQGLSGFSLCLADPYEVGLNLGRRIDPYKLEAIKKVFAKEHAHVTSMLE